MKKMMIALVAMFVMTMSANAQSNNNNHALTFDRISSYLGLTISQVEPVRTAFAQFMASQKSVEGLQDEAKMVEGWGKVIARHKETMKNLLTEKQYEKYDSLFDQTIQNTADKYRSEQEK